MRGKGGREAHSDFSLGLYYAPKLKPVPRLQLPPVRLGHGELGMTQATFPLLRLGRLS